MNLTPKAWDAYKNWRADMERNYGRMIYAPAAPRARVRFDGPVCLDRPSPDLWTVIDPTSPYFKMSHCLDGMLGLGFTAEELYTAKSKGGN